MAVAKYKVLILNRAWMGWGETHTRIRGHLVQGPRRASDYLIVSIYKDPAGPHWLWQTTEGDLVLPQADWNWGSKDLTVFWSRHYQGKGVSFRVPGGRVEWWRSVEQASRRVGDSPVVALLRKYRVEDCCFLDVDRYTKILLCNGFQVLQGQRLAWNPEGGRGVQNQLWPANIIMANQVGYLDNEHALGWELIAVPSDFDPNSLEGLSGCDKLLRAFVLAAQELASPQEREELLRMLLDEQTWLIMGGALGLFAILGFVAGGVFGATWAGIAEFLGIFLSEVLTTAGNFAFGVSVATDLVNFVTQALQAETERPDLVQAAHCLVRACNSLAVMALFNAILALGRVIGRGIKALVEFIGKLKPKIVEAVVKAKNWVAARAGELVDRVARLIEDMGASVQDFAQDFRQTLQEYRQELQRLLQKMREETSRRSGTEDPATAARRRTAEDRKHAQEAARNLRRKQYRDNAKRLPKPHTTKQTRYHMYEGEIATDPQSAYKGKWSGDGIHQWDALQDRVTQDGYSIEDVTQDPVTGVRRVKVKRVGADPKTGVPTSGQFTKTVYPKDMSPDEIDAAGEQAFQNALSGAPDTKLDPPGTKMKKDGTPVDGYFEGIVQTPDGQSMRVQGWYRQLPGGSYEIVSHAPAYDKSWPSIPKSDW